MRILHISSAKTFGGGERHLVDLCRLLHARGHEIFVGLRPTNEWQHRFDFLPSERFMHVSIRNSFGMFSAKRIAKFITVNNIDIVHAHVARDYLAASVAARISGIGALVLTRHVLFPMKPFHRFALKNVNAAIAVSPAVSSELAKIFPRDKIVVIPNGIAAAENAASAENLGEEFRYFHGIPVDVPLVTTIGELKVLKGQRDFVLAAQEVVKKIPECRFVIAGRDNTLDSKYRRELKRLVKVFGMEDRFLWLDWLDDLKPLFDATDVFVSPSHTESFGLAILEAMAHGNAVVATDTEGAKELLDKPEYLTPVKDPLKLANRIIALVENDDERARLGAELRQKAAERFSLSRMASSVDELYSRLTAHRADRRN